MLNDFYRSEVLEQSANALSAGVSFNAGHEIFAGHFPVQPVVPGVCTMAIVKALLEGATGIPLQLKEAANVKFLRLLTPIDAPQFSLNWTETGESISLTAQVSVEGAAALKMTAHYVKMPQPVQH